MPRAYWKGYLKLSLVTCPVELFPASTTAEKTRFHRINLKTGHRLRQQLVDEVSGRVVAKDNVGRGYELARRGYVPINDDEVKAVRLESTHTIDIDHFVPWAEVDHRYLERPYYLAPRGATALEAFSVIRDALADQDRVALGRVVFANREHIVAIEALGKGMLATTLRYDHEVRSETDYFKGIKSFKPKREMVELARHIFDRMKARFDPSEFKDRYETALRALVKRKAAGKVIEPEEAPSHADNNVVDLFEMLKQSLDGPKGRRGGAARRPARKKTARRKAA